MLDIRKITFLYFTILYILFRLTSLHYLFYIVAGVIYIGILIYGSFYIGSNFYLKTICSVKTGERKIALTFDDGPDEKITPQILTTLEKFDIKAAFFCTGKQVTLLPALVKEIHRMGHIIGNHSYSHSNGFDFYSASKITRELEETEKAVAMTIGKKVKFFRPPFGVTNPSVAKAVKNKGYIVIGWNIRALDTLKRKDPQRIIRRIMRRLSPGAIILMHDKNPDIIVILEKLLAHFHQEGYQVVRLDQLINQEPYA